LTIEEFDGRRRSSTILIPERHYGQGWDRLISELKIASSSLWEGHVFKESKMEKVVSGRWSFAEVLGLSKSSKEECFYNKKPIARIPRWLKEASAAVVGQTPTNLCGGNEKVLSKAHSQMGPMQDLVELGGVPNGGAGRCDGSEAAREKYCEGGGSLLSEPADGEEM
jgi:hypothetical protein